jgi:hypothetical protein
VLVKIADGVNAYGINSSGIDLTAQVVQVLHKAGIEAWGWHSVHGVEPSAEAVIGIARAKALGLDGYVVDAGEEYDFHSMAAFARQFMASMRTALEIPIALSSFRFPNYHPEFPWSTFLEFCDLHMPKVTWEQAHNPGEQLRESFRQCDALPNARPYIPTGAAYTASGWSPSTGEINEFMNTALALGLQAVNFYHWEPCRQDLPHLWKAIAGFDWSEPSQPNADIPISKSMPEGFIGEFTAALNSSQPDQVIALYDPDAVQVRADQVLCGAATIKDGYATFFRSLPAGTVFDLSQVRMKEDTCLFTWKAGSLNGKTTFVVKNGKILLEYSFIF